MRKFFLTFCLLSCFLTSAANSSGPPPSEITYQGKLTDADGQPISNSVVNLQFSIWDSEVGGMSLWSQSITGVSVNGGLFTVSLDLSDGLDAIDSTEPWLEISVNGQAPLTPRTKLTSVPFAIKAGTVPDNSITLSKIDSNVLRFENISGQISPLQIDSGIITGGVPVPAMSVIAGTDLSVWTMVSIGTDGQYAVCGFITSSTIDVVDVSNPEMPVRIGGGPTAGWIRSIAVDNGHAFVTGAGRHLEIFSLANPASPTLVGHLVGSGYKLLHSDNLVYITDYTGGNNVLRIYDVSVPNNPTFRGQVSVGSGFSIMTHAGSHIFLTMDEINGAANRLHVVSVANPFTPSIVKTVNLSMRPDGIAAYGNHLYISADSTSSNNRALWVYEISDPVNPVLVNTLDPGADPAEVYIWNNKLLVGIREPARWLLYGLDDPASPQLIDKVGTTSFSGAVYGDYFFSGSYLQMIVWSDKGWMGPGTVLSEGGITVDAASRNAGTYHNALKFGSNSGEAIGSNRTSGLSNLYGLDFYTASRSRVSITNSGRMGINTTTPGYQLHVNGSVAGVGQYINVSDGNFKKNIASIKNPLETVNSLRGVTFDWRRDEFPEIAFPENRQLGFIAQEVEHILPEAVVTSDDGTKSMIYTEIIPVLVEAIKAQQKQIETSQSENSRLQSELADAIRRLKVLEERGR